MSGIRNKRAAVIATASVMMLSFAGLSGCSKSQTSEALLSEAKQYQQKGDLKAAIIQLKNALQKNPDDAEARYLLGNLYNQTGDPQSAEKELRKALSLGISAEKIVPGLAKSLLAQAQFQKVLNETQQDSRAQNDVDMLTLRGNAYLGLGKAAEAKDAFQLALKMKPDSAEALIGLARHALLEKDIEAAERFADQAVTSNPKNADAWIFKGDVLRAQGKTEPALAAYNETLKIKPGDATAHILKAYVEIGQQKFPEAKADIEAARKSAQNGLIVLYTQALLDFSQKNHAAALESLQQVLRTAPEHMPSILLAGAVQYSLGATQQAEQHLKKYLDKNPDNLYARKLLASALLKNNDAPRAIQVLAPALNNQQQDAPLLLLAGEAYMKTKDFTKATEYFEKANTLAPEISTGHTALGISRLQQGEAARAVAELEKAVSLDTKSLQAGILLVMTHLRLNEYDKAFAAVTALEKEQPDNPLVHNLKGGVYFGKKDVAAARASFEKAVSLQSTFFPAIANLAQLDLQDKKPEQAKKRFEAVLEKDRKNIQAMMALANLALTNGKNDEAKNWLERANNENPEAIQPAQALVAHYLRTNDKQKALTTATKLQSTNPNQPQFLELLAQAQLANGNKTGALDSYNKLAALVPDSAPIQFRIASANLAAQNEQAAMTALKKALRLDPHYVDAQLALAGIEVRKGNFDEALAMARQLQKQQPTSPAGHVLEGDVLIVQKKPGLAIKPYEQALTLQKHGALMVKLHAALVQAGKKGEADSRINQWLKANPADISTRMYLGELNLLTKQNKAAIEQFQTILRTNPKNAIALNNLAWAYDQEKDPRALEYAQKAHELAPDSAAVLDTLGWMLIERGDTSRGLPFLQKAATLAPDVSEIRYHFALGLMKSGDKANARKELEQLLASGKNFAKMEEAKALLKQL